MTQTSQRTQKAYGLDAYLREKSRLENCQDLRDDICAIVLKAGNSLDETLLRIHEHSGPHPHTIRKWLSKETNSPQLGKIRATLEILGYSLKIVEK